MDITNYLCKRMIKKLLPIMGLMLGLSVGSFLATARLVDISSYRMEQILNFSGISILYYLAFVSVPIIMIYTLETTALKPGYVWPGTKVPSCRRVFWGFYATTVWMTLMVTLLFYIIVIFSGIVLRHLHALSGDRYMNNYIFLAFVRTDSLRRLFPLSAYEALRAALILFAPSAVVMCACYSLRCRHYENFLWMIVWAVGYWQLIGFKKDIYTVSPYFLWARLFFVALFTVYFGNRCLVYMREYNADPVPARPFPIPIRRIRREGEHESA